MEGKYISAHFNAWILFWIIDYIIYMYIWSLQQIFLYILRLEQNVQHIVDGIIKGIFLKERFCIFIKIYLSLLMRIQLTIS